MAEIDRRYFDNLMRDRGLSLRALATKLGMNHSQLSLTLSGARRLQLDEAAQLSQIFGEPLHRVVEAAGVAVRPVSGRRVSVVGAMVGDGTVSLYGPEVVERTTAPEGIPDDGFAIQCRTAGTPQTWMDGFVFFCRPRDGIDAAALGRFCFCRLKDGTAVMATVRRGYTEGTFNLSGPYSRDNVALESATPVDLTRN